MKNLWTPGLATLSALSLFACSIHKEEEVFTPETGKWELLVTDAQSSGDCIGEGEDLIGDKIKMLMEESGEGTFSLDLDDLVIEVEQDGNNLRGDALQSIDESEPEGEPEEPLSTEEDGATEEENTEEDLDDDQQPHEIPMELTVDFDGELLSAIGMEGRISIEWDQLDNNCLLELDFTGSKVDEFEDEPEDVGTEVLEEETNDSEEESDESEGSEGDGDEE